MTLKHLVVSVKNLIVLPKLTCYCSSMSCRDLSCQAVFGCVFEAIESQSAIKLQTRVIEIDTDYGWDVVVSFIQHCQVGWYMFILRGAGTMLFISIHTTYILYIEVYSYIYTHGFRVCVSFFNHSMLILSRQWFLLFAFDPTWEDDLLILTNILQIG